MLKLLLQPGQAGLHPSSDNPGKEPGQRTSEAELIADQRPVTLLLAAQDAVRPDRAPVVWKSCPNIRRTSTTWLLRQSFLGHRPVRLPPDYLVFVANEPNDRSRRCLRWRVESAGAVRATSHRFRGALTLG